MATAHILDAAQLFEAHRDRIYRYILHLVHNAAEADDLTQETFLRAHRGRESLRDPGAVVSWLYRIATDVCWIVGVNASRRFPWTATKLSIGLHTLPRRVSRHNKPRSAKKPANASSNVLGFCPIGIVLCC